MAPRLEHYQHAAQSALLVWQRSLCMIYSRSPLWWGLEDTSVWHHSYETFTSVISEWPQDLGRFKLRLRSCNSVTNQLVWPSILWLCWARLPSCRKWRQRCLPGVLRCLNSLCIRLQGRVIWVICSTCQFPWCKHSREGPTVSYQTHVTEHRTGERFVI